MSERFYHGNANVPKVFGRRKELPHPQAVEVPPQGGLHRLSAVGTISLDRVARLSKIGLDEAL